VQTETFTKVPGYSALLSIFLGGDGVILISYVLLL